MASSAEPLPEWQRRPLLLISIAWTVGAGGLAALRMATGQDPAVMLAYAFVALLPMLTLWGSLGLFGASGRGAFARFGSSRWAWQRAHEARWTYLSYAEAAAHPLFGVKGWLLSLAGGLLLSVLVRASEFYLAMPAPTAAAPGWYVGIHAAMLVDLLLFSVLYVVVFAAALRHASMFPMLLCAVWALDAASLAAIRSYAAALPDAPAAVAIGLDQLIVGNLQKLGISVALWLPYLLFSRRVGVTYFHRVRNAGGRSA